MWSMQKGEEEKKEEGRPGAIPLIGRGIRPVIPRFQQEGSGKRIFTGITWQEGEVGHSLHPSHSYRFTIADSPIACHAV